MNLLPPASRLFPACLLSLLVALPVAASEPLPASTVAIVYNSKMRESQDLAQAYAKARQIPDEQLLGLPLPDAQEISREQFETELREPLTREFEKRRWLHRDVNAAGGVGQIQTTIRVIVNMRGVPLKIKQAEAPRQPEPGVEISQQEKLEAMLNSDNAAVDSELTLLPLEKHELKGAIKNVYYQSEVPAVSAQIPMYLVGRIDGPSLAECQRMISDAIETEKTGLWGFAVVDMANKSAPGDPSGDPWLVALAAQLRGLGIPTLVDHFNPTLPTNFPLPPTSLYYGWYSWHVDGPFKNPKFRFKKGAVAVHLHSFSAAQVRDPKKNWVGPLLASGAAATLGNTYEPFLHLTHNFQIFQDRLLKGFSLIEAAYMSIPVVSWQGVVLGDPLYRPFLHLDGTGEKLETDKEFRAIRLAQERWGDDPATLSSKLIGAAERMKSGTYYEALGLELAETGRKNEAASMFLKAGETYTGTPDKIRADMLVAKMDWEQNNRAAATQKLRELHLRYPNLPETAAIKGWLNILDPPPPPPTDK